MKSSHVFTLPEGELRIDCPMELSAESLAHVQDFLEIWRRGLERRALEVALREADND